MANNGGSGSSGGGGRFGGGGASDSWGDDKGDASGGSAPGGNQGAPSGGDSGSQGAGGGSSPGGGGGSSPGGGGGSSPGGGGGSSPGGGGGSSPGGGGGSSPGGGGGSSPGGGGGSSPGGGGGSSPGGGGGSSPGGGGASGGGGPGAGGGTAGGGITSAIGGGAARIANQVKTTLEIKDTGNAKVDALGDIFNAKLGLFTDAPPPEQGALGVVNKAVQVAMALKNFTAIGQELMDTGFAMATAGIAAMMPALPAAFLTVPHLGTPHAHAHPPSLVPPAPPVPLPSIGTLMLAGSVGVLICGMPAGRSGDLGLAMTCGSFSPAFDVFLGSSNTFIAGSRAARMGDMTRHCNPASAALAIGRGAALFNAAVGAMGIAADAVGGGPVMGAIAQVAADLAAAAMSALLGKDPGIPPSFGALMLGAPTVLIGGFPCPNLPNPLDAMMHGLKCLGKAFAKSKAFGKLLSKVGLCNSPTEPVNPLSGEVYSDSEDYKATDSGFVWERHYRSGWNQQDGPLGYGFRHFFQRSLTLHRKRAVYQTHDNEVVALAKRDDGTYQVADGLTLRSSDGQRFRLTTDRAEALEFEVQATTPPTGRLTRYTTKLVDARLYYDAQGRLRALTESPGGIAIDTHLAYDGDGHIEQVVRGVRGGTAVAISRYAYRDGCIVEWYDATGALARMYYDAARRLVKGTDRRGYSFHWHYDPRTGRCIKAHGDDGLWGAEATYQGLTSTFTEQDGGKWTFKHYPNGQLSHVVDPLGGVKQYVADARGRITKQIQPNGVEVDWLYAPDGKLVHRRDQWGNLIPPEDDVPGLPDPTMPSGPNNQRDWLLGRPHRQLVRQLAPLHTALVAALAQLGPFGQTEPLLPQRDAMGRIIAQPRRDGSVETFQLDPEGNVIARLDTKGNWWQRQIVSWNLVGAERSPSGAVQQYAYNHREHRTCWIDGNGNRGDYVLDLAQRVTEIRHQGAGSRHFLRSPDGTELERRDQSGKTLAISKFGPHGLRTATILRAGDKYVLDYDEFGNCIEASSDKHEIRREHIRKYPFHPIPYRTVERRDGQGIRHGYDGSRQLDHSVYFERFAVDYRLLSNGKQRVFTPAGGHHDFYVSANGETVRENGNGTVEVSVFDREDRLCARLCSRRETPQDGPRWSTRYRYNAEAELVEQLDTDTGTVRYGYDNDHRLISQQDHAGLGQFAYDPAGNLALTPTLRTVERLPGNLLSYTDAERFEYDDGARLSKRTTWDGKLTTYAYDDLGQLVAVRCSATDAVWNAAYDSLGRRIWREYAGRRTDFYWDGDRLAAEVAPDKHLRIYVYANTDSLVPFMWLDYDDLNAAPESGVPFFLFSNGTGMPLRVEDRAGALVWRAERIEAYGHVSIADGAAVELRLRFAGHFLDEHTGLFYNRHRDYDPGLGRYLQPDPIDFAGGINLYAYPSNPLVEVDLLGLVPHKRPIPFKPEPVPEHLKKPLDQMSDHELKELCKHHADELARAQDTRPKKDTNNTFAVGVIETPKTHPDGKPMTHPDGTPMTDRRLVATSNLNDDDSVHSDAKKHMANSEIEDKTKGEKPHLTRQPKTDDQGNAVIGPKGRPESETVKTTGEGNDQKTEPYDKTKGGDTEHHAEQRMENQELAPGEKVVAQSPSQGCCEGCQKALGTPDDNGQRPIDKIPEDRQQKGKK